MAFHDGYGWRAAACASLTLCLACGGAADDAQSSGTAPEAAAPPGEGTALLAPPGPCHEPVELRLCIAGPAVDAERVELPLGGNSLQRVVRLEGEVSAKGVGALPANASAEACRQDALGTVNGLSLAGVQLQWAQLDVRGRDAWISLVAPAGALPIAVGETVSLSTVERDDYLLDYAPHSSSLTLRGQDGSLLAWLGSAEGVDGLQADAPGEALELQQGATQCVTRRGCERAVQRELQLRLDGTSARLTQAELGRVGGFQALVGRSEAMELVDDCLLDGTDRTASIALWRAPD